MSQWEGEQISSCEKLDKGSIRKKSREEVLAKDPLIALVNERGEEKEEPHLKGKKTTLFFYTGRNKTRVERREKNHQEME